MRNIGTAIDHFITITIISSIEKNSGIIRTDISNHFPIFILCLTHTKNVNQKRRHIYGEEQIEILKHELSQIECDNIIKTLENQTYENLFNILFETYDKHFPEVKELKAMKYILGK